MAKGGLAAIGAVVLLFSQAGSGRSEAPLTVAVADFAYIDTSGEVRDQTAEHQARVAAFAELLREEFERRRLPCAAAGMSRPSLHCASAWAPDEFTAAARRCRGASRRSMAASAR